MARICKTHVRYSRNGCSLEGFYRVNFADRSEPNRPLIAIIMLTADESGEDDFAVVSQCAVIDPANPSACFRGDYYQNALHKVVRIAAEDRTAYA